MRSAHFQSRDNAAQPTSQLSTTPKDAVTFVPLGGLEEVGRNMSVFEYGNEIIIIDMGLQFPEEDTPGIDYIIPNITSLLPKRRNIKGIIITHGHYDHIGAIPYLMDQLGASIPIYTTALTREIIKKRQDDFPHAAKLNIITVTDGEEIQLSEHFSATVYEVEHTIPDAIAVALHTPVGTMAYCTDLKFDYDPQGGVVGRDAFADMGKQNIHTLFLDSTNAEKQGRSVSERLVEKNLEDLFAKAQGRIIVGMFSSLLSRVSEILKIAERHDRKVALSGFSLKANVQIAQNLGYIKTKKGLFISMEEVHQYRDDKVLILSTGAQGESNASLMKIANGENRNVVIKKTDTVIFSSSVIPGNERSVQSLKDTLTRQGAKVYQSNLVDLHSSGHAPAEELKEIISLVKPRFFIPIHGYYFMRSANAYLAAEVGIPLEKSLLVDNGQMVIMQPDKNTVSQKTVNATYVMVDGLGVGDVEEVVMRDRNLLSQEGMLVVIATLDRRTGQFLKNPDIISRGFIHLKDNKEFVEEVRKRIKNTVGRIPGIHSIESDYLKTLIRDQLGQFIYNKTKRRPMILPVVIEV
jgi:ribonuclease J